MRKDYLFFVYILASRSRVLYVGVTNQLVTRVTQHRSGEIEGFASRYKVDRLVYFEMFGYIDNAIAREKQVKGWLREKKIALITAANPTWEDLYPGLLRGDPIKKQIFRFAQDDNV